jgi:hypothetical protein
VTINEIYAAFIPGSVGFCNAVSSHCGFCTSDTETARIADLADTAEEFQSVWENDDSWTDASNPE